MAVDLPMKTVIELVFFALFVLLGIFVIVTFYNALFPSQSSLDELKTRAEFIVCGGYSEIDEKNCSTSTQASTMFFGPASQGNTLIFFDADSNPYNLRDNWEYTWRVDPDSNSQFAGVSSEQPSLQPITSPCEGACVCEIPHRSSQIKDSDCVDLDYQDLPVQTKVYLDKNAAESWNVLISNGEFNTSVPTGKHVKPYQVSSTDDDTYLYMMYMYYDASSQKPTLHIIPFIPE